MPNKRLLQKTFTKLLETISVEKIMTEQCRYEDGLFTVQNEVYDLSSYNNIYLIGSGKAVLPMAKSIQELLKERLSKSLLVGGYENAFTLENTHYIRSTHPTPSLHSVEAAEAIEEFLAKVEKGDFVFFLLSGGNSALVEKPMEGISLEEMQKSVSLMLKSGMPIEAMNCVRKHLSQVKGGRLVQNLDIDGAVLVLSDVLGDDLHAIGSAPYYYDTTTFEDARGYLYEYDIYDLLPQSVQTHLKQAKEETPKAPHPTIKHFILGSNSYVLEKAKTLLEQEDIEVSIISEPISGDVEQVAKRLVTFIKEHKDTRHCYIFGGEATVHVRGDGKGGRNQHLVLEVLHLLDGDEIFAFLSAATDGIDGNSDAAGALIDSHSIINKRVSHIDWQHYLEQYDSNSFFKQTDELLISGPTHNNLLDIVMLVVDK